MERSKRPRLLGEVCDLNRPSGNRQGETGVQDANLARPAFNRILYLGVGVWCNCGPKQQGYTNKNTEDLWVCSKCGKPSKMVFEGLTNMRGPKSATCLLSVSGKSSGVYEMRWATANVGERVITLEYFPYSRKVHMDNGREILLSIWEKMDIEMDDIMSENTTPEEKQGAKLRARAFAEVLALCMGKFYESADAIAAECHERYKARQTNTPHETPGLAEEIWDPNTRWDGTPYGSTPEKRKQSKRTGKSLPLSSIETIRNSINLGMFTASQIADTYGLSAEEVKEQLGLV